MPGPERFIDDATAEALKRRETRLRQTRRQYGPVRVVDFPNAGAVRQVAHGLGVVATGYDVCWTTGAVYASSLTDWTAAVALLTAPVANTRARLQFYVDTERDDAV